MFLVKIDFGFDVQTLEFGGDYVTFKTEDILKMLLDLLDGQEIYSINIERTK